MHEVTIHFLYYTKLYIIYEDALFRLAFSTLSNSSLSHVLLHQKKPYLYKLSTPFVVQSCMSVLYTKQFHLGDSKLILYHFKI